MFKMAQDSISIYGRYYMKVFYCYFDAFHFPVCVQMAHLELVSISVMDGAFCSSTVHAPNRCTKLAFIREVKNAVDYYGTCQVNLSTPLCCFALEQEQF